MKENTRFCTRSLRDNARFGGVIQVTELSPITWIALRRKDYCRQKI